jgi:hypothetical protein
VQLDRVAVELETTSNKPDHTFHLRSLATQVAAGIHVEPASDAIRELLAQESELDGKELDSLYRVIRDALA